MNPWSALDGKTIRNEIIQWSSNTFGPAAERGPTGPLKHLIKEAGEALADPKDILEYADCQILIWDAAARAGFSYDELLAAVMAKYAMLKHRQYPKTADGEVSEHIKDTAQVVPAIACGGASLIPANMRADFQPGDPKEWPPKAALVADNGESRDGDPKDWFTQQVRKGWR